MRVTDTYGLNKPVPFVDVFVERDNRVFLDPSAIRNDASALGKRAHGQLLSYFGEVIRCRASANAADQTHGLRILQELHEPNQTRLGMSATGVQGHGWGPELGEALWDELASNVACRTAALTRLEDLKLFIPRVAEDLISDMTTRVIFDVLVDFTHKMVATYPALGRTTVSESAPLWKSTKKAWVPRSFNLPDVPPHPLLLVPKRWVYWRMLMNDDAFYNRFSTTTVQDERATVDMAGRRHAPRKSDLHEEFPDVKRLNNEQAASYMQQSRDLVAEYRAEVDHEFEPLTDEEIERRTSP